VPEGGDEVQTMKAGLMEIADLFVVNKSDRQGAELFVQHLMTMMVDALQTHPDGVTTIANRARAAGASEAEIQEAVEVVYLFGGTPALVTAMNAFKTS